MNTITKTFVAATAAAAVLAPSAALAQASSGRGQRDQRYQIGMMEGVLEKAVEHGASEMRERLRTVMPADMLLSKPVHVRGIPVDGFGVIFDVDVPSLQSAPLWSLQTLDQNNLGIQSALSQLRASVDAVGDRNLQQALQRIELALDPLGTPLAAASPAPGGQGQGNSGPARQVTALSALDNIQAPARDQSLTNPARFSEQYRAEIKDALMEAMLDYSRGLNIGGDEWLIVVAGASSDDQLPLTGLDTQVETVLIRIKGVDLADFLSNRITHDEARQRMEVKVF
jgi:hypothetical protein